MKRSPLWYLIPPLLALLHGLWFLGTGPVDDDYICFRYARHLVEGHGLVFNLGERFEGFTTPLWVFLHAGWQALGGSSPQFSVGVGIVAFVASCAWMALWARREERWPWAATALAAAPAMAWHAVAGLGTVLLGLCVLGAYLCHRRAEDEQRAAWGAALWLAVACALRQESVLFVLPFAYSQWKAGHSRTSLLPLGVLVSWTLFRLGYYGRILPLTYHTKKLPVAADLAYGWRYFLEATQNFGLPVLLLIAGWGSWRRGSGSPPGARHAAMVALLLYTVYVVSVGGDFMVLSRFFVPILPLLFLLAFEALQNQCKLAAGLALVLALGMQWNQVIDTPDQGPRKEARATRVMMQVGLKQRWAHLGEHMKLAVPAGSRVAISPIGAFGWTSDLPLVDILGLTNDSVLHVKPNLKFIGVKGHHRTNFAWILDQKPEYMVLGNGTRDQRGNLFICPWERGFFEAGNAASRFAKEYRQASMQIPDDYPLDLFIRRDLPLPPQTQWVAP